jgi:hypothetical protein
MPGKSASVIALELYNEPRLSTRLASMPLHEGVLSLIKIAAGDEAETVVFPPHISSDHEKARAISVFYLQQILFHPQSTGHRLLGLSSDAGQEMVRDHKRWLLKWLHPDRNQNKWEQLYFERVIKAAQSVQDAELNKPPPLQAPQVQRRSRSTSLPTRPRLHAPKQPVKLNVWPRLRSRLKQTCVIAILATGIYLVSTKTEVTSAITQTMPDLTSIFNQ